MHSTPSRSHAQSESAPQQTPRRSGSSGTDSIAACNRIIRSSGWPFTDSCKQRGPLKSVSPVTSHTKAGVQRDVPAMRGVGKGKHKGKRMNRHMGAYYRPTWSNGEKIPKAACFPEGNPKQITAGTHAPRRHTFRFTSRCRISAAERGLQVQEWCL